MALFKGTTGKISFKKKGVGLATETFMTYMTNWSVESSFDVEETSYFGGSLTEEGFKEKTAGAIGWNGSAEGSIEDKDDNTADLLHEANTKQTIVDIIFYLDAESGYEGEAYIDNFSVDNDAGTGPTFSVNFAGNGQLKKFKV